MHRYTSNNTDNNQFKNGLISDCYNIFKIRTRHKRISINRELHWKLITIYRQRANYVATEQLATNNENTNNETVTSH